MSAYAVAAIALTIIAAGLASIWLLRGWLGLIAVALTITAVLTLVAVVQPPR